MVVVGSREGDGFPARFAAQPTVAGVAEVSWVSFLFPLSSILLFIFISTYFPSSLFSFLKLFG